MKISDLIRAAQEYDLRNCDKRHGWRRVPDSQVARLLIGAKLAKEQRQVVLNTSDA